MKLWGIGAILMGLLLTGCNQQAAQTQQTEYTANTNEDFEINPISHASFVLVWDGVVIVNDPTGDAAQYTRFGDANIILVSDIHGDHLSADTLGALVKETTNLIVPRAVADELPDNLKSQARVMANGEKSEVSGFTIEAMPMYNLPEVEDSRHPKGRGNGYLLEKGDRRVYIAGDTAGIPEMRALKDIDIAFVPMNPPFTMDIDEAADAVLDFVPVKVYPYHYRGREGLSDVEKFKTLVNEGNSNIEVVLLNWYPKQE